MRCHPLRLAKISSEMEGGGFHFTVCGSGRRSTWIPCFMQESVTRRIPCVNIIPPDGFQLGGE